MDLISKSFWYLMLAACYLAAYGIGFFRWRRKGCQVRKRYGEQAMFEYWSCTVLGFFAAAVFSIGPDFIQLCYYLPFTNKNTHIVTAATLALIAVLTVVYWITSRKVMDLGEQRGAEYFELQCIRKRQFCRAHAHATVVRHCPMSAKYECPCGIERRIAWRIHPHDLELALLKAKHAEELQTLEEAYGAPHRDLHRQEISVPLHSYVVPATSTMNPWHPDLPERLPLTVDVEIVEIVGLATRVHHLALSDAATEAVYVDPDKVVAFNPPEVVQAQLPSTVEGSGRNVINLTTWGKRTLHVRRDTGGKHATQQTGTVRHIGRFTADKNAVATMEKALREAEAREG